MLAPNLPSNAGWPWAGGGVTVLFFLATIVAGGAVSGKGPVPPAAHAKIDGAVARRILSGFEARHGNSALLRGAKQLVLVVNQEAACPWARLFTFERAAPGQAWRQVAGPLDAHVGKRGFSPPGKKAEGDLTTPTGLFPLGPAFGYLPTANTRMEYRQATPQDCWVDDPRSPDYNRWVPKPPPPGVSHEKMRRSDALYSLGLVIRYNDDPVVPGRGSAIFLHIRRTDRAGTAGCVAVTRPEIAELLAWLDQSAQPVILMGARIELETLRPGEGE